MEKAIEKLNTLMIDFYSISEEENTSEMFLEISGKSNKKQVKSNEEKNKKRIKDIEDLINNPNNFEEIINEWTSVDQKMLDSLFNFFKININNFLEKLKQQEGFDEIKEFFLKR